MGKFACAIVSAGRVFAYKKSELRPAVLDSKEVIRTDGTYICVERKEVVPGSEKPISVYSSFIRIQEPHATMVKRMAEATNTGLRIALGANRMNEAQDNLLRRARMNVNYGYPNVYDEIWDSDVAYEDMLSFNLECVLNMIEREHIEDSTRCLRNVRYKPYNALQCG